MADIRHAIETRDAKLLRRSAHTLKGSVNYFGASTLVNALLALETHGHAESFDGIADALANVEQELAPVLAALEAGP